MKTTVVPGLLGSGKTTFIGDLLRDARERAVVLVNDFGAPGIDGEVIVNPSRCRTWRRSPA